MSTTYESDFYAALGLGFGKGVTFITTYTAQTSPNNWYSTVKEFMFKLGPTIAFNGGNSSRTIGSVGIGFT